MKQTYNQMIAHVKLIVFWVRAMNLFEVTIQSKIRMVWYEMNL